MSTLIRHVDTTCMRVVRTFSVGTLGLGANICLVTKGAIYFMCYMYNKYNVHYIIIVRNIN